MRELLIKHYLLNLKEDILWSLFNYCKMHNIIHNLALNYRIRSLWYMSYRYSSILLQFECSSRYSLADTD